MGVCDTARGGRASGVQGGDGQQGKIRWFWRPVEAGVRQRRGAAKVEMEIEAAVAGGGDEVVELEFNQQPGGGLEARVRAWRGLCREWRSSGAVVSMAAREEVGVGAGGMGIEGGGCYGASHAAAGTRSGLEGGAGAAGGQPVDFREKREERDM